jgi:flagellar motor switch protein FliG
MPQLAKKMTGIEKASVLMASLSATTSAKVFEHLNTNERERLSVEIIKIKKIDRNIRKEVLNEVCQAIKKNAKQDILELNEPLKWMEKVELDKVVIAISNERPQNIALILANISPKYAAEVLALIPEKTRNEVALKLASIKSVSPEAIKAIDETMRIRIFNPQSQKNKDASSNTLSRILSSAKDSVRQSVVGALSGSTPSIMQTHSDEFKCMEDIFRLSDVDARAGISMLDYQDIEKALAIAGDPLKEIFLRNMDSSDAQRMSETLAGSIQIRIKEVEIAQEKIVDMFKMLVDDGKIRLLKAA